MRVRATWDNSGEIIFDRELGEQELLDCDIYAEEVANMYCVEIAQGGFVPIGCGEINIELADNPGTAVCWQSKSYFLKHE